MYMHIPDHVLNYINLTKKNNSKREIGEERKGEKDGIAVTFYTVQVGWGETLCRVEVQFYSMHDILCVCKVPFKGDNRLLFEGAKWKNHWKRTSTRDREREVESGAKEERGSQD